MAKATSAMAVSGEIVSGTELTIAESKFRKQSQSLYQQATHLSVTDPESLKSAIEFGRGVNDLIAQITGFFKPLKKAAKASHTALCDAETEALAIPESAQSAVDAAIRRYRQAEAEKAQAAAEKERARLEAQAIKERAEAARLLQKEGEKKLAREVLAEPIVVQEVEVRAAPKVTAGTRYRTEWHFEITDPAKIERRFLVPDERLIRAEVREKKQLAVGNIAGVRVWSTEETDY
jgi:hypothetical protein